MLLFCFDLYYLAINYNNGRNFECSKNYLGKYIIEAKKSLGGKL